MYFLNSISISCIFFISYNKFPYAFNSSSLLVFFYNSVKNLSLLYWPGVIIYIEYELDKLYANQEFYDKMADKMVAEGLDPSDPDV